jgi:hypothetical protein
VQSTLITHTFLFFCESIKPIFIFVFVFRGSQIEFDGLISFVVVVVVVVAVPLPFLSIQSQLNRKLFGTGEGERSIDDT